MKDEIIEDSANRLVLIIENSATCLLQWPVCQDMTAVTTLCSKHRNFCSVSATMCDPPLGPKLLEIDSKHPPSPSAAKLTGIDGSAGPAAARAF